MRARDVIGRKIVAVKQQRYHARPGRVQSMVTHLYALILDDGTQLCPVVRETEIGEYAVEMIVHKDPRQRKPSLLS